MGLIKRFILLELALLLFWGNNVCRAHTITIVKSLQTKTMTENFDCTDTIYADVNWDHLKSGDHVLNAQWINPTGKQQESTVYKFKTPVIDSWLWLKLDEEKSSHLFNGTDTFAGYWKVDLFLDGNFLATKKFHVAC